MKPKMWTTICFDTDKDFIKEIYYVKYDGYTIEVKRGTNNEGHNLFIETNIGLDKRAYEIGLRLLSEIAWLHNTKTEFLGSCASGHKVKYIVNRKYGRIMNSIGLEDYEQIATNNDQKVALGIYREGISSSSHFYGYLSFFRIINIKCHGRKAHYGWINNNINKVRTNKAVINEIKLMGVADIGEHLYQSGRCAIAHACLKNNEPVADPDNYHDNLRINKELPLVKELAEIFIKDELGVSDRYDAFSNSLVKNIRALFSESAIKEIIKSDYVDLTKLPKIPTLSIRIFDDLRSFNSLKNLKFEIISAGKGIVILSNQSQDWPFHVQFSIDFNEREINFCITEINKKHLKFNDKMLLDFYYFFSKYLPNGRLEIWNENKNELLARLPAYIPVDMDVGRSLANLHHEISLLEAKVEKTN